MKIAEHVQQSIEHIDAGKFDAALIHACIAVDATAKRCYPSRKVRDRYVQCIRDYYWLIEPMLGAGIDLVDTRWGNVPLARVTEPDWAEVVYEIFRCSHLHGDEVPPQFSVTVPIQEFQYRWRIAKGELHMPTTVVPALLAVTVFAEVNEREKAHTMGTHCLTLAGIPYRVDMWWGREKDFRPIADKENEVRVVLQGLTMEHWSNSGNSAHFAVVQPGYGPKE